MPSTLGYISPNKDSSSSKLTPSTLATPSLRDQIGSHGNTIFIPPPQAQEHHHHPHPFHHHQPQQLNPQEQPLKSRRDPDQDPDPAPPPITSATTTSAPLANTAATTTTNAFNPAAAASSSSSCLIRYRQCLKNHAATTGGHVLDGCGEFMPSGEDGSPEALKCAACDCHRNFHRKEIDGGESVPQYVPTSAFYSYNPNNNNDSNNKDNSRRSSLSALQHAQHSHLQPHHHLHHQQQYHHHPHPHHRLHQVPPMLMAFGGEAGTAAESSSEDLNMFQSHYVGGFGQASVLPQQQPLSASKKRFRTKFTQPQKDKMMEFAEKLGWKIQKHDEQEVQQFCSEVGVKRKAFKVWMHNNKQAMKKKQV